MSLKIKTLLISFGLTAVFLTVIVWFVASTVISRFQELEDQSVQRELRTVDYALEDQFKQLSTKILDWVNWDDTYKYLSDKNSAYEISNLSPETFGAMGIDKTIFVDKDGRIITKFSTADGIVVSESISGDLWSFFERDEKLLAIDRNLGFGRGVLRVTDGLVMFVVREVHKSDGSGLANGKMVFVRYLNTNLINEVKTLTELEVSIKGWDETNLPQDYKEAKELIAGNVHVTSKKLNDKVNAGYLAITDVYGIHLAIVRIDVSRDISIMGRSTAALMVEVAVVLGVIMIIMFSWLLTMLVMDKIQYISSEVESLIGSGMLVKRLQETKGSDEIDKLRKKINQMLDSMQTAQVAIDNLKIHIIITNPNGVILFANKAAEKTTGYLLKEMVGNTPRLWGRQMAKDYYENLWAEIKVNKRVFVGEVENIRKNGEKYFAAITISPVLDEYGNIKSFVGMEEDITEQKNNNELREKTADRLKRINDMMVGRELQMIDLKKKIRESQK